MAQCALYSDGPDCAALIEEARHTYNGIEPKQDRKSTRLNSSHLGISYAVFCLKKKNRNEGLNSDISLPHTISHSESDHRADESTPRKLVRAEPSDTCNDAYNVLTLIAHGIPVH